MKIVSTAHFFQCIYKLKWTALSFNDPFRFFTKCVLFHPVVKSHISEENHWLKISPLHKWNIHSHTLLNTTYCTRVSEHTLTAPPRVQLALSSPDLQPMSCQCSGWSHSCGSGNPSVHQAKILQTHPFTCHDRVLNVKWLDHEC